MNTYPKIDTLFRRDDNFNLIVNEFRRPVMGSIRQWRVTEKIDGTNIRITYRYGSDAPVFGGRTDRAELHPDLVAHLEGLNHAAVFDNLRKYEVDELVLFGEGYGAGIQSGGAYRSDKGFIMFDALVSTSRLPRRWLDDDIVTKYADMLGAPRVPELGVMSLIAIVAMVRIGFESYCSQTPVQAEGVVARPLETLYDQRNDRLILKLKTSDFKDT